MSKNEHTGDSIVTKTRSAEERRRFEENYEAIFKKDNSLCHICGKELSKVTECAWTSCPKLFEE